MTGSRFGGRERQLQAWGADDSGVGALEDTTSNGGGASPGPGPGAVQNRGVTGSNGQWDQFATNEKLYGLKTDYNEEFYTTKLDRSGADYRQREQKAAQLEREILKVCRSALMPIAHLTRADLRLLGVAGHGWLGEQRAHGRGARSGRRRRLGSRRGRQVSKRNAHV